jgi:acetyltransferase-like isoleucine patch superfamily enzyme
VSVSKNSATTERIEPKDFPVWRRALLALKTEVAGIHPRLQVYQLASSLLPPRSGGQLRAGLLRWIGVGVGPGTNVNGPLKISGPRDLTRKLVIGSDCNIDAECVLDLSEQVTIGDRVTIEAGVMILTSTHTLDFPAHRAGPLILNPVSIGAGAWLRARCIILPGVEIGAGAVVDAGAVVNKSVEPNTRVGGSPAAKLEALGEQP